MVASSLQLRLHGLAGNVPSAAFSPGVGEWSPAASGSSVVGAVFLGGRQTRVLVLQAPVYSLPGSVQPRYLYSFNGEVAATASGEWSSSDACYSLSLRFRHAVATTQR
jgi:hypothetical protein